MKKGISSIVTVVLIVLITVAAVAVIWVAILPMIGEDLGFPELDGRVSIVTSKGYTLYDASREIATVQVGRDGGGGEISRVKIIFSFGGNSYSVFVTSPGLNQMRTYAFNLSGYGVPGSVSVAPIFVVDGGEREGSVTSTVDMPIGVLNEVPSVLFDLDEEYQEDEPWVYEVPLNGMLGWWRLDGNAVDDVGGNNGTLVNMLEGNWQTGISNEALSFDGVNDYVFVPNSGSLDVGTTFSGFAWVYPLGTYGGGGRGTIMVRYGHPVGTATEGWRFWLNSDNTLMFSSKKSNSWTGNSFISSAVVPNNEWSLVGFTANDDEITIYINSQSETAVINSGSFDNDKDIVFGMYAEESATEGYYFNGLMDEIMIYDVVLSEEEVLTIYEAREG